MLKSLARAPARSAATKPQRLSPLQRVLIGQVIGIEPKFAAHEILRLSKQKDNNPVLSPRPTIREPAPSPPIGYLPANAQAYDFRPQISPMGGPLTGPEVARILRMCCDNQFPYRAPLTCIAEVAGVHRSSLYRAVNTGEVGRDILTRLSPVLRKIAAGKLAWRRLNVRGKGVGRQGGGQWEEFRPR